MFLIFPVNRSNTPEIAPMTAPDPVIQPVSLGRPQMVSSPHSINAEVPKPEEPDINSDERYVVRAVPKETNQPNVQPDESSLENQTLSQAENDSLSTDEEARGEADSTTQTEDNANVNASEPEIPSFR
jgi:hypothetical protein